MCLDALSDFVSLVLRDHISDVGSYVMPKHVSSKDYSEVNALFRDSNQIPCFIV